jgi:hypothetical protein
MIRSVVRYCRRGYSLPVRDQWLLVETVLLVVLVRAGLFVASYPSVRDGLDVACSVFDGAFTPACPRGRVPWAVGRVASALPGTQSCLVRALVAETLLVRRGYPAALRFGVDHSDEEFAAHAWVESGSEVVVGGEVRPSFTRLR